MLSGSIVALVTPMTMEGEIDFDAVHRLVDWHLSSHTDGIVVAGSTGESPTLTLDEKEAVLTAVVKQVKGRIPVVMGTGSNSTAQTVAFTRKAQQLGADAALVVVPYYNRPTQEGLRLHYESVAQAGLPIFIYNVPARTCCDILPETVVALSSVKNIVGIKETVSLQRCITLIQQCPENFVVLTGEDPQAMVSVLSGAAGIISAVANVIPEQMHELISLAQSGAVMEAKQLDARLQPLINGLFCETNPIAFKWALKEMGLCSPMLRLPLTLLSEEKRGTIRRLLEETGVACA